MTSGCPFGSRAFGSPFSDSFREALSELGVRLGEVADHLRLDGAICNLLEIAREVLNQAGTVVLTHREVRRAGLTEVVLFDDRSLQGCSGYLPRRILLRRRIRVDDIVASARLIVYVSAGYANTHRSVMVVSIER